MHNHLNPKFMSARRERVSVLSVEEQIEEARRFFEEARAVREQRLKRLKEARS